MGRLGRRRSTSYDIATGDKPIPAAQTRSRVGRSRAACAAAKRATSASDREKPGRAEGGRNRATRKLAAKLLAEPSPRPATWVELTPAPDFAPTPTNITLDLRRAAAATSDVRHRHLPQVSKKEPNDYPRRGDRRQRRRCRSASGATFDTRGDADHFAFDAKAGQKLGLRRRRPAIGSKADAVLTLFDASGSVLAAAHEFDSDPDPLLAFTPPRRRPLRHSRLPTSRSAHPPSTFTASASGRSASSPPRSAGRAAERQKRRSSSPATTFRPTRRATVKAGADGEMTGAARPRRLSRPAAVEGDGEPLPASAGEPSRTTRPATRRRWPSPASSTASSAALHLPAHRRRSLPLRRPRQARRRSSKPSPPAAARPPTPKSRCSTPTARRSSA